MKAPQTPLPPARPWRRLAAVLLLLGLLWVLVESTGLRARISPQSLRAVFADHGAWGFIAFAALF
ncbi:hypothetical protein Q6272_31545, partial [Klebsiella pneumoniae]|uniref:hypothetical protein n=1 Tax=Klebsiella pneumoniae TaxID=573 RepID=UPI00273111B7